MADSIEIINTDTQEVLNTSGCCGSSGGNIAATNALNPDAPEFQKGYKRENNTGCCGICGSTGCIKDHTNEQLSTQIIRQRNTRDDFGTEV